MDFIKTLLLTLLLLIFNNVKVSAQDSLSKQYSSFNNLITISIGHWSADMMTVGWGDMHRRVTVKNYSEAFAASYKHRISPRAYMGLGVGYEREGGDTLRINITGRTAYTADTLGRYRRTVVTAVPECIYIYKHDPEKDLVVYGLMGAGICYVTKEAELENSRRHISYPTPQPATSSTKYSKFRFNGQISPVCFKIGTGRLSGCLEFGFGYKGLVCGGLVWKY